MVTTCGNCETREAALYCLQCDKAFAFFCESCIESHNQMKAFRGHEVVPLSAFGGDVASFVAGLASSSGTTAGNLVASPSPKDSGNHNIPQGLPIAQSSSNGYSYPTSSNLPKSTPSVNFILSKNKQLIDFDSQISSMQQLSGLGGNASQGADDGQRNLSPRGVQQEFPTGPGSLLRDPTNNNYAAYSANNGGGNNNGGFEGPGGSQSSSYDGGSGFRGRAGDIQQQMMQQRMMQQSVPPPVPPQGSYDGRSSMMGSSGNSLKDELLNMRGSHISGDLESMSGQMLRDKMQSGNVDYRDVILQHSMQSGGRNVYQTTEYAQYLNDGRGNYVSPFPAGDNSLTIYVECPYDKVKLVIGSKGVVIKNIMRRTNTAIWIDENFPIAHPRKIEVCGARDDVFQAKALLLGVIEYGPAFLEHTPGGSPLLLDGGIKLQQQQPLNPSNMNMHAGGGGQMNSYPSPSQSSVNSLNEYSHGGAMRGGVGVNGRGMRGGDYMMNPDNSIAMQRQEQIQQLIRQQQQQQQQPPQYSRQQQVGGGVNNSGMNGGGGVGSPNFYSRNSPPFTEEMLYSRSGGGVSRGGGYPSNFNPSSMNVGSPHLGGSSHLLNELGSSRGPGNGSTAFGKVATSIPPVVISEIYCPTERVSIIIGTKGVIINEISKRSNTIISIDEDPDKSIATLGARLANLEGNVPALPPKSPLRRIEIRGTLEGIEIAKHLINGVVASGPSFLTSGGFVQDANSRSFYAVGNSGPPSFDRGSSRMVTPRDIIDETGQRMKANSANSSGKGGMIPIMNQLGTSLADHPSMNNSDGRLRQQYDQASPRLYSTRPPSEGFLASMQQASSAPYDLLPPQIHLQNQGFMSGNSVGAGVVSSVSKATVGDLSRLQDSKQQFIINHGSQLLDEGGVGDLSSSSSGFPIQQQHIATVSPPPPPLPRQQQQQDDRGQLRRLIQETLETMTFPTKHIGELMGVNGATLRAISQHSGADIIVNTDLPPEVPRILEVRGTPEQVATAREIINSLLNKIAAIAGEDLSLGDNDDADRILKSLSSAEDHRAPAVLAPAAAPVSKKIPIGEIRLNAMSSVDSYESLGSGLLLSPEAGHGLGSIDYDDETDAGTEEGGGSKGARIIKFPAVYLIAVMLSRPEILERIAEVTGAEVSIQSKQAAASPPSPKNRSWQRSSSATKQLVAVSGEEDNVKEAVFLVRKVLAYLNGDPTGPVKQRIAAANEAADALVFDLIEAPPKAIYRLIGFRGASIKEISDKAGASITVMNNVDKTKEPSTVLRQVVLFGSQSNVANAKDLVMQRMTSSQEKRTGRSSADTADGDLDSFTDLLLQHKQPSSSVDGDDEDAGPTVHCCIECPPEKVGLIIGYKGVVIKNMMARSKAKIIVSEASAEGKETRDIDVTGTARQVEVAKSMIETIITHGNEALDQSVGPLLALGIVTKELSFPANALDELIAEKGSDAFKSITRRRMNVVVLNNQQSSDENESASSLTLGGDGSSSDQRTLLFKGTLAQIEKAENELRDMLAQISAGTPVEQASSSILMMNSIDKSDTDDSAGL